MKTIKKDSTEYGEIIVQIEIADDLTHGRKKEEMQKAVREGLLIRDYVNAEISIGKFAELMEMNYEDARDWLHRHGIATTRTFTDPKLEKADEKNYRLVSKELGISAEKEG
jgi:predicted HTH domain antitoxin